MVRVFEEDSIKLRVSTCRNETDSDDEGRGFALVIKSGRDRDFD
jgi:hypothetical protein